MNFFVSYARKDRDQLQRLRAALTSVMGHRPFTVWADENARAGADFEQDIEAAIAKADVVILLISPAFMDSKWCTKIELPAAVRRMDANGCRIAPIVLKSGTSWKKIPIGQKRSLGQLNALPSSGAAISGWRDRDEAWEDIARGLRNLLTPEHANAKLAQLPPRNVAIDQMGATLDELIYWRMIFESWQHYYAYDYDADSNLIGDLNVERSSNRIEIVDIDRDDGDDGEEVARYGHILITYNPPGAAFDIAAGKTPETLKKLYQFRLGAPTNDEVILIRTYDGAKNLRAPSEQSPIEFAAFLVRAVREQKRIWRLPKSKNK